MTLMRMSAGRTFLCVLLGAVVAHVVPSAGFAQAAQTTTRAEDVLPPDPANGEWLQDTLVNDDLWFASSNNLTFESMASGLSGYPRGHRWVGVANGKPAWVIYYVPGEILGFEIDTHHLGARGVDFQFSAGGDWQHLTPVEVGTEELAGFENHWLRMYRAVESLPAGTRFLRIDFPGDGEGDFARLTEVWLRCRFDDAPPAAASSGRRLVLAPSANHPPTPASPAPVEPIVAPYVVTTFVYDDPPAFAPASPVVQAAGAMPEIAVKIPPRVTFYDLLGEFAEDTAEPAAVVVEPGAGVLSRFISHLFGRNL